MNLSDIAKHKMLQQYVRSLCLRELIEYARVWDQGRKRYNLVITDSPDTAYQIISEIKRMGFSSGPQRKIDRELIFLYREIDKILDAFRSRKACDDLVRPKKVKGAELQVKRVNIRNIIPFFKWLEHGTETDYGKIYVSFFHMKYLVRYASAQLREIFSFYATDKGWYQEKKGKRLIMFYLYPYEWTVSTFTEGNNGVMDMITELPEELFHMEKEKRLTFGQALNAMRAGMVVRVPNFDGYFKFIEGSILAAFDKDGNNLIEKPKDLTLQGMSLIEGIDPIATVSAEEADYYRLVNSYIKIFNDAHHYVASID